ncbi:hypothetical protein GF1_14790 [Desulfolithobacter dissulfuricans]|uniref:Uncharacterized protein n=1 Tax=Desulfolithobacter dissulfuricans TaxID=2795293 RepID=A0A915XKE4_9BACT|nr:hypothetical protein GF1_14790 [Desulfolithobacter dissulfuricans]
MADDSVVVMKFRPVKPGNSVEDKTGVTQRPGSLGAVMSQKPYLLRRDEVYLKVFRKLEHLQAEHKPSDGTGHAIGGIP